MLCFENNFDNLACGYNYSECMYSLQGSVVFNTSLYPVHERGVNSREYQHIVEGTSGTYRNTLFALYGMIPNRQ